MAADVRFRRAVAADLPAIVTLLADDDHGRGRERPGLPLDPGYRDAFAAIDASPDALLVVAEADGRLVGCCQLAYLRGLSNVGARKALLTAVRVAADRRGGGIGAALVGHAMAEAAAAGCRTIELTSHGDRADAHRFYARLGFAASHVGMKRALP